MKTKQNNLKKIYLEVSFSSTQQLLMYFLCVISTEVEATLDLCFASFIITHINLDYQLILSVSCFLPTNWRIVFISETLKEVKKNINNFKYFFPFIGLWLLKYLRQRKFL